MRQSTSYPKPFKAQVVQECLQPSVSVASVALRHGLNANLVRSRDRQPAALPAFVTLPVTPVVQPVQQATARIDVPFGLQMLSVQWPASDPDGCARLIRGLMP